MNNAKTTRKALFTSIMALIICVTMLMGTTFAWFTDTATVAVNTIKSGNLKIDLVDETGASLKGETLSFGDEDTLWEPGCRYTLPNVYVKNLGNLAFKYTVIITGIDGNAKLNDAIVWEIDYGYGEGETEGHMAGDAVLSEPITIKGVMKEDAGNEYQGLSIDGIAITVMATQDTVEEDSIDNTYDTDAEYDSAVVNTAEKLAEALEKAEKGDTVYVSEGTYDVSGTAIPAGVKLVGIGDAVFNVPQLSTAPYLTVEEGATVENIAFVATVADTAKNSVIKLNGPNTSVKNCTLNLTNTAYNGIIVGGETANADNSAVTTITGCEFIGGFEPISCGSGQPGEVVIDSCTFVGGSYSIHLNTTRDNLTVTNCDLYGWVTIYGFANSNDQGEVLFENCTFTNGYLSFYRDSKFVNCEMASSVGCVARTSGQSDETAFNVEFEGCTWEGTTVVDKFINDPDFAKDFSITVDGATYDYTKATQTWTAR